MTASPLDPETPETPEPSEPSSPELESPELDGEEPSVVPNRSERRAARKGGPAAQVQGPAAGRRPPVPAKPRDYASRRRGG